MSVLLMMALVMMVVMFLFLGIFKDFAFQQQGRFGLVPGTETVRITDSDTWQKATIECRIISGKTPPEEYEYTIKIDKLGFSYTSKAKVYPIFLYRGRVAASEPVPPSVTEEVELPGRLSFNSMKIKYKIEKAERPQLEEFATLQKQDRKESVVIGFFKRNDKCLDLAKASAKFDDFVKECARSLETETSVLALAKACV